MNVLTKPLKMIDHKVYNHAVKLALKVEFLINSQELFLYAGALYAAMMWSREVDRKNDEIQEKDKRLK